VRDYAEMLEMEHELVDLGKSLAHALNGLQAKGEDQGADFSETIRPIFESFKSVLKSRGLL